MADNIAPPDLFAPTSLRSLLVRPVLPEEQEDWNALMAEQHERGYRAIVGEAIHDVALLDGERVAVLGFGAAALTCRPRDRWIGWLPPPAVAAPALDRQQRPLPDPA